MWKNKRAEEEKTTSVTPPEKQPVQTLAEKQPVKTLEEKKPMEPRVATKATPLQTDIVNIGKSVYIKGELTGDEDLTIEGRVEGKIELRDHNLVIGPNGKISAAVNAKNVTVIGSVVGNICASEMVEIKSSGSVVGDIQSARLAIADGAHFKGSVDLQGGAKAAKKSEAYRAEPFHSSDSAVMPLDEGKASEVAMLSEPQALPPLDFTSPTSKVRVA